MKLYTEEQVIKAIELARDIHTEGMPYMERDEYDYSKDEVIASLTPIKIPSDEEIENVVKEFNLITYRNGFRKCAKWMKEQIINQNK